MDARTARPGTRAVHAGEIRPRFAGAVALPIFQSSTFEYGGGTDYHDIKYIRLNNTPNHDALHAKIAALEDAEAALVTASGMAAISGVLLSVLRSGDHVLHQDALYGGTHALVEHDLPPLGIEHTGVDPTRPDLWAGAWTPRTKAFYVETIGNPRMSVPDLRAVVAFCREHDLVAIVDNTFASPINFRPIPFGFDLVVHSCTKYMNGHSDIVAGCVAGSRARVDAVKHKLDHLGGSLDPHACFLLHRGLKTLALRMDRHNASALEIARFLEDHPAVERVDYPGLVSSLDHERAAEYLSGCGGMLAFELTGGAEAADRLFERLTLPVVAPSLGGVESLITRPATTSHSSMTAEQRAAVGIGDGLVRLSVGIEDTADLIEDLRQALA